MKRTLIIILALISSTWVYSQSLGSLGNVDQIFQMYANDQSGGKEDAERYLTGYIGPALNGIGFGVTGGWYNTGETHKLGGFDITTTVTLAVVPDVDKAFSMENANTVDVVGGTDVPSIMGSATPPTFQLKSNGQTFEGLPGFGSRMEEGIGYAVVPTPMAQVGVGLPKGFELKLRYIPKVNIDGLQMNMTGIGVMHNIKQWIPGVKLAPFDLAAFVGYNRMNLRNTFETTNARNGEIIFAFNSFTYQAIISKTMSIVTVYAGVGAANTGMDLKINGEYDIDNNPQNGYELTDPIDMGLSAFGGKMSAGFRLKLAVVSIHADYTFQKYNALTVGVGVSIK